ncbi:MAG: GlsB/YeaQ/YmgE family stress response membrane protein [Pseudomonadota bacterium]
MGFLFAIIIGGIAGFIAEKIMSSPMGLLANIGLGIVGGLVGAFIASLLGIGAAGIVGQLIIATLGACLLIWAARMLRGTV